MLPREAGFKLESALEELQLAQEELRLQNEQMQQQNEELATAKAVAQMERQHYQELFESAPEGYLVINCSMDKISNFVQSFLIRFGVELSC